MALSISDLTEEMITAFIKEMEGKPDVLKSTTVTTTPLEDGTTDVTVNREYGPPEVNPDDIRPMMTAIATAIVNHLKENAYADDTDPFYGGNWRIK